MLNNILKLNALHTETIAGTWYSTYHLSYKYSPNPSISFNVRSAFSSVFTKRNKPRCINSSYNTKKNDVQCILCRSIQLHKPTPLQQRLPRHKTPLLMYTRNRYQRQSSRQNFSPVPLVECSRTTQRISEVTRLDLYSSLEVPLHQLLECVLIKWSLDRKNI